MAWLYESSTGKLFGPDGKYVSTGYSGGGTDPTNLEAAKGKNNPAMQNVHNEGPICEGWYTMLAPVNSHVHGPYAIPLQPDVANEMHGRDAFMCHADSIPNPGWASEGCVIQIRTTRVAMWESKDHRLHVVAKIEPEQALAA